MSTRIIDRDIDFYQGEVEAARDALRRCTPGNEPVYEARAIRANAIVLALEAYRSELGLEGA
ncbi:hypothetical protein EPN42_04595 [bacterium]|nr:MAG: hypothetical protein EPN42_04595 [bacterium]